MGRATGSPRFRGCSKHSRAPAATVGHQEGRADKGGRVKESRGMRPFRAPAGTVSRQSVRGQTGSCRALCSGTQRVRGQSDSATSQTSEGKLHERAARSRRPCQRPTVLAPSRRRTDRPARESTPRHNTRPGRRFDSAPEHGRGNRCKHEERYRHRRKFAAIRPPRSRRLDLAVDRNSAPRDNSRQQAILRKRGPCAGGVLLAQAGPSRRIPSRHREGLVSKRERGASRGRPWA